LSTEVTVDTHSRDGAVLGAPAASAPVYSTEALGQPVAEAEVMAKNVIEKNLTK
jgi:membrane fusion protein (multidrug efflux system)